MRLALFLAVTFGVVGQWRFVDVAFSNGTNAAVLRCGSEGWTLFRPLLVPNPFNPQPGIDLIVAEPNDDYPDDEIAFLEAFSDSTEPNSWRGLGIAYSRFGPYFAIRISHWLAVTVFAIFYAALKWVYRMRDTSGEVSQS